MSTYTQDITHLIGKINTNLPDNDTQAITAARLRDAMGAVAYNYDLYVLKTQLSQELGSYVLKTDLDNAGYVTASALSGYATQDDLQTGMQSVLDDSYAYVVEKINEIPGVDLSAYVTKTELSEMGYITENDLPDMSTYATKTYVADYVASYAPTPDLSAYVTKTELREAGYLTAVPSEYITDTELSSMGYITSSDLPDMSTYATKTYVADYVATHTGPVDLSAYVTKDELSAAGYLTAVPSEYITDTELSNVLSTASYVTSNELSNAGYITNSDLSQASYVTQQALSGMGYITTIPSEYVTESQLQSTLTAYITETKLSEMGYITSSYAATYYLDYTTFGDYTSAMQDTLINANILITDPETGDWTTQTMASETYVADYVASYAPTPDLSTYVTKDELSAMGYITAVPSEYVTESQLQSTLTAYITETKLSEMGYITSSYAATYYLDIASFGDYTSAIQDTLVNANILVSDPETGDWTPQLMASETYVAEYVASYAPTPDLSTYVTKTELSAMGYITSSDLPDMSSYATLTYLETYYATTDMLSDAANSIQQQLIDANILITDPETGDWTPQLMASETYVTEYVASYAPTPDLSAYATISYVETYYATNTALGNKQDTLVSGTNIKTINNESLLGSGNIDIQGGGSTTDYSHVLKFTAEQANSTIKFKREGTATTLNNAVLQYSTDNGDTWNEYTLDTTITLAAVGDTVKFKGTNNALAISPGYSLVNYHRFVMTGKIAASGDVTSLLNETGRDYKLPHYAFVGLFYECTALTKAPNLPSTTLSNNCYGYMFFGCTSLTTAPELPATTTIANCYNSMFYGCTSLTTAPELPATTVTYYCYSAMFYNCTSLTKAPSILPATTLAEGCYSNMFQLCKALTTAPILPATTLSSSSYSRMFYGCTSLKYVKTMMTTNVYTDIQHNNIQDWLYGINTTGTLVKSSSNPWTGNWGIPSGWTIYKAVSIDTDDVPESYVEDNGMTLQVVNGLWTKVTGGGGDMSAYVTKTELSAMGYLTAVPSEYVTETELSAMGYLTSANLIYDSTTNTLTINV